MVSAHYFLKPFDVLRVVVMLGQLLLHIGHLSPRGGCLLLRLRLRGPIWRLVGWVLFGLG
jgi:hypothetical protein